MNRDSDLPLHLFQVLEEEYESLHGPLRSGPEPAHVLDRRALGEQDSPPASPAGGGGDEDRWREAQSERSWRFLPGHVKDPVLLAAQIVPQDDKPDSDFARIPPDVKQLLPSFDLARENLKRHIYRGRLRELSRELVVLPPDESGRRTASDELKRALEAELNELLKDEGLYHPNSFSPLWLSPAGRALIAQRERHGQFHGGGNQPGGDRLNHDLAHFNRLLLEDAFSELERIQTIRLAAICRKLHKARPAALSLSGGGIRSGTFALGLLQGLARHDLLKEFDYLSTVSGGGYIGSWLTAWLHRHPEGLPGVTRNLANCPPAGKIDPEPQPLLYLRQFSNFITPKVGLLTADTWAFVGIYLRNLLLNWMVVVPLLVAALLVPRLLVALTLAQPETPRSFRVPFTGFDLHGRHAFLLLGFMLGIWALAYINFNRPGLRYRLWEKSRRWRNRSDQRGFLRWCFAPLAGAAVLLTTYFAWSQEINFEGKDWPAFLGFGAAFGVAAYIVSSVVLRRWQPTASGERGHVNFVPYLIALLVAVIVGALLFWVITQADRFAKPVVAYKRFSTDGSIFDYLAWQGLASWRTEIYVCAAVPLFLLVVWGATTAFVGLSSTREAITDEDREWWARFGAWLLIGSIVWVAFSALVIFGPLALLESPRLLGAAGGVSGLVALLLGRSSRTPANRDGEAKGGLVSKLTGSLLPLLALLFLAVILAALSLGTSYLIRGVAQLARPTYQPAESVASRCDRLNERLSNVPCDDPGDPGDRWAAFRPTPLPGYDAYLAYLSPPAPTPTPKPAPVIGCCDDDDEEEDAWAPGLTQAKLTHMNVVHHTSIWFVGGLLVLLYLAGHALSRVINLNIFSLHGGYRNRLIRGFLGASRPPGERKPNPFTGFDEADNISMHELRPGFFDEDDLLNPARLKEWLLADEGKAAELSQPPHPATLRVSQAIAPRLEQITAVGSGGSQELVSKLRMDLNRLIADAQLFEDFREEFMQTGRARRIRERILPGGVAHDLSKLRTDYRILLNRLVLEQAYAGLLKEAGYPPPPYKLLHVVNTALNLVGGDNLAWQQRKAEPFSISPLHSGCFRLGYRESSDYGGGRATGGISIGTAAAISGAAASSNMGYYTTSPVLSLLLTLFNVRLGWWLGNPGPAGHDTFRRHAPRNSVLPVLSEAFGMTDDRNEYVYLTDGGHFENLALYEMVLRRCRVIVCSDGAQDEQYRFGDLGNAVRKIRIDLGIPIEFTRVPIYAEEPDQKEGKGRGFYWAVGRIRYGCVDRGAADGVLIYVKPAVYGNEPRDILEYKKSFPAFPHQSTGDQFFDEPQFESYRALGSHVIDQLCGEEPGKVRSLYNLVEQAFEKLSADLPPADTGLKKWLPRWLNRHDPTSPPRPEE